jgi:glutathione peroxidase
VYCLAALTGNLPPLFGLLMNLTKFLIGRDGEIVNRFDSKVKPESKELTEAVAAELAKK